MADFGNSPLDWEFMIFVYSYKPSNARIMYAVASKLAHIVPCPTIFPEEVGE